MIAAEHRQAAQEHLDQVESAEDTLSVLQAGVHALLAIADELAHIRHGCADLLNTARTTSDRLEDITDEFRTRRLRRGE